MCAMLEFISILVHLILIHNSQPSAMAFSSFSTVRLPLCVAGSNQYRSVTPPFSFPNVQPQALTLSQNRRRQTVLPTPHSSTASMAAAYPPQSLKSRLKKGDALYGIFIFTFSPALAEIAGLAGYDFAVVDLEHGNGGISDILPCLHALAATNTPAIVRIPECSSTWTKKVLDLGPQGIMFPMIDGPEAARKVVSYCRFPPHGIRGSANSFVRASEYGMDEGYLSKFEEELLIMCQVESEAGFNKIKEIADVDGVDCIQTGPRDLSSSLGYLLEPGHKKVREVLHEGEKAVLEGGAAYLGGIVMPHDRAHDLLRRGYHMVSAGADVGLFRSATVDDVTKFKVSLALDLHQNGRKNMI